MTTKEFKKLKRQIDVTMGQFEKEAVENGVSPTSKEFNEAAEKIIEKLVTNAGFSYDEFANMEANELDSVDFNINVGEGLKNELEKIKKEINVKEIPALKSEVKKATEKIAKLENDFANIWAELAKSGKSLAEVKGSNDKQSIETSAQLVKSLAALKEKVVKLETTQLQPMKGVVQIYKGNTPPEDKTMLWCDTSEDNAGRW
ncbi:MAG: hypothetical protein HY764_01935 [Candidatus Portnoybacteria bacterium]|nr:hypothetical protein [Candidatus Portnoybacteria bacterium]